MSDILSNREQFLADRRTGIGGSDAAALIGLSPYKTEHDVYMDKLGLSPPSESSMRMEAGLRLEPVIAEWYANDRNVKLTAPPMIRDREHPFMIAHIDRFIDNGNREGMLEIKTTDVRFAWLWGDPGTDSVPDPYNLQCQHYLAVTGLKWADIAVLIGGNDFRIYRVPRNDDLIKNLIRIENDFWTNHVMKQVPPEIAGTESCKTLLGAIYPHDSGREVLADEKIDLVVQEYFDLRGQIEGLESAKLFRELQIKKFMGTASIFKGLGYRFSWKQNKDGRKVKWETIARELWDQIGKSTREGDAYVPKHGSLDDYVAEHTKVSAGARPFRPTIIKEKGE